MCLGETSIFSEINIVSSIIWYFSKLGSPSKGHTYNWFLFSLRQIFPMLIQISPFFLFFQLTLCTFFDLVLNAQSDFGIYYHFFRRERIYWSMISAKTLNIQFQRRVKIRIINSSLFCTIIVSTKVSKVLLP